MLAACIVQHVAKTTDLFAQPVPVTFLTKAGTTPASGFNQTRWFCNLSVVMNQLQRLIRLLKKILFSCQELDALMWDSEGGSKSILSISSNYRSCSCLTSFFSQEDCHLAYKKTFRCHRPLWGGDGLDICGLFFEITER